jgi:hypothetical protein
VWQALRSELYPKVEIVTVGLDTGGADAVRPWIEAAKPEHPSVIDAGHVTDELLGFCNVPMAVWIDEDQMLVRPAEQASPRKSPLRQMEIPEGLPEGLRDVLVQVQKIPDRSEEYMAALRDWVDHGPDSRYALSPDEVVARSRPRSKEWAEAAACFELGQHLWRGGNPDGAVPWWRAAHRLDPNNWTYKRQAWSLAVTEPGQPTNLLQGPTDLYEGDWVKDIRELGAENYYPPAQL